MKESWASEVAGLHQGFPTFSLAHATPFTAVAGRFAVPITRSWTPLTGFSTPCPKPLEIVRVFW